jgi:putrescine transport system substrate-binding protein
MQLVSANDPGNEHGVPYLRGTTSLGYNPEMVEKVLGTQTIDSLAAIFDPAMAAKLAECGITWLDAPADMFQLAFIYLGLDANSHRPEDLAAAEALLTRVRPYVRHFHSSQYLNDLASGEVCLSVGWSGGIEQARQRGAQAAAPVEVTHVIPKEGAPLWCDMVASLPFIDEAVRNNASIDPSEESYAPVSARPRPRARARSSWRHTAARPCRQPASVRRSRFP